MVVIRLSRGGAKKRPFYSVVVTDRRNSRDGGRFIERIGYFNPNARGEEIKLHFEQERINYWTAQGAQPSERVQHLMQEFFKNPELARKPVEKKPAAKAKKKAQQSAETNTDQS